MMVWVESTLVGSKLALEHSVALAPCMCSHGYNHSNVLHGLHRNHATSAEIKASKFVLNPHFTMLTAYLSLKSVILL